MSSRAFSSLCLFVLISSVLLYSINSKGSVNSNSSHSLDSFSSAYSQYNDFLAFAGNDYGYDGQINTLREKEFPHLKKDVYLDYAGAGIPPRTLAQNIFDLLTSSTLGNPHTKSPSSSRSTQGVSASRAAVLKHFNADPDHWTVVFTSGTTAGIKLLADGLPWTSNSLFMYTIDNHVSVLGIREQVKYNNGSFKGVHFPDVLDHVKAHNSKLSAQNLNHVTNLFAFPAQSNFAGNRYPLDIINEIYKDCDAKGVKRWEILLDAASLASCCSVDLSSLENSPGFLPVSFYKIFGYPTGLGALVAKKSALADVSPRFFGGGTVTAVIPDGDWEVKRGLEYARLEYGTISFTDIMLLSKGFEFLESLGMHNIARHTMSLTYWLADKLASLQHSNGQPVVKIYGNFNQTHAVMPGSTGQGPIIAFSVCDSNGNLVSHSKVLDKCYDHGISVRAGCVCNHGSCFYTSGITHEDVIARMKRGCSCDDNCCGSIPKLQGTNDDVIEKKIEEINQITNDCWSDFYPERKFAAIVRASIGFPTTFDDVAALVQVIEQEFKDYSEML
ncbi:hypothetical protein RCL1_000711 [Eukaryota sp. TZLM3-RCL]